MAKMKQGFRVLELTPLKTIYAHDGFYPNVKDAVNVVSKMQPGEYVIIESYEVVTDPKKDDPGEE